MSESLNNIRLRIEALGIDFSVYKTHSNRRKGRGKGHMAFGI